MKPEKKLNSAHSTATHLKKVLNMLVMPCCWTPFSGESGEDWRDELTDPVTEPGELVSSEPGEPTDISLDLDTVVLSED